MEIFKSEVEFRFLLSNTMPPRGSKTKRHPNGALETTFQVQGKDFTPIFHCQPKC